MKEEESVVHRAAAILPIGLDALRPFIELALRAAGVGRIAGAEHVHGAGDARLLVAAEDVGIAWRNLNGHGNRAPAGLLAEPLQLLDAGDHRVIGWDSVREPAVAVGEHALVDGRPIAADQDRWMWLLKRFGKRRDPIEVDVAASVARLLLGPHRFAGLDALAQDREALLRVRAVVAHLLQVPAGADAEQHPAAGEAVHGRDLLGSRDRVAFDQQADRGADLDPLGRRGHAHQRDERVVDAEILTGQLATRRVSRVAAERDVRVLGDEYGLETALLRHAGELAGLDGVVGREVGNAEVHYD